LKHKTGSEFSLLISYTIPQNYKLKTVNYNLIVYLWIASEPMGWCNSGLSIASRKDESLSIVIANEVKQSV